MPPKNAADYADEIRTMYPATTEEAEVILNRRVTSFVNLLDITIFTAQNEQKPWTPEELGYQVRPMLLKEDCGVQQVGDYQAYYSGPGIAGWVGLLVERKGGEKGCEDLYSTLMNSENCARFYREIGRYNEDPRFSQMVVIAECTFEQFLLYRPPFIGKKRNTKHIGASVAARRGKIASLHARGVPVVFCGTRKNAIEMYKVLVRQWLIKNYVTVLGLGKKPFDDEEFLKNRLARLEVEMEATRSALNV
jgi:hypothetical protein